MSKGWNDSMLKKLKSLIGKGLSTSEMGKKLGMSKNAVVGKLNRLGWNAKASETEEKPKKATKTAKTVAKKAPAKKVETKKAVKKPVAKVAKTVAKKAPVKKQTEVVSKKAPAKKAEVKAKKAPAKEVKKEKTVAKKEVKVIKAPVVKPASKKTKKDLALHELMIQHALQMANLKSNQCRWPIGDPDSDGFHFCGKPVFPQKPYCYEHCRAAYQFTPTKKK